MFQAKIEHEKEWDELSFVCCFNHVNSFGGSFHGLPFGDRVNKYIL